MKWVPRPYQKKAVKWCLERGAAGLFLRPGLGKTSITLAMFDILRRQGLARRLLIVCPLRVLYEVWPEEVELWDEFQHLRVVLLHGKDKDKAIHRDADIYVVNFDGLEWLESKGRLKVINPDVLVVDESTKLKNTRTRRFKSVKPMLNKFKRRYILTGTPSPNGLLDLFGQIFILDQGVALGRYISHYRAEYFDNFGFDWMPRKDTQQRVSKRLEHMVISFGDENIELPQLVENDVWVELPPAARKTYDEMETILITQLTGGEVVKAVSKGVALGKCRQIANGGLYSYDDENNRHTTILHTAKLDAVVDLVDELSGQPALIAYEFQHELEQLLKAFPGARWIGGGAKPMEVKTTIQMWNAGELQVLLGQPQSMGHGLNLQGGGDTVIWAGLTYNAEDYDQLIKRIHRSGNKHSHTYVHRVVAKNTVDAAILAALRFKDRTQAVLMESLKHYARIKR